LFLDSGGPNEVAAMWPCQITLTTCYYNDVSGVRFCIQAIWLTRESGGAVSIPNRTLGGSLAGSDLGEF